MKGHFLIKMTDMLHRIRLTIIKRESRLIKSPRKAHTLYPPCERRFSNLVQRFIHGFVSKALVCWALILMPMATILLVARESFTGRSSWLSLVHGIICLLGRRFGLRRWAPSPCAMQLLFQLVNLTLHFSFILCMRDMALPPWLILTSVCSLYTSFTISPLLRIYNRIITLRTPWLCLVRVNITLMRPDRRLVRIWLFHFQH